MGGKTKWVPQPRWRERVDLAKARESVADIVAVWLEVSRWEDAPFSGGVFDSWPRRIAQGIAFCRNEARVVMAYLQHLEG